MPEASDAAPEHCPACGSVLSHRGAGAGLCPACVLELALESPSLMAELEEPDDETLRYTQKGFAPGQVLGERYRVRSLLGRGGMGEVWRAFDLKLRLDVALKALRPNLIAEKRALEALRQEVRVARGVISPNVCRVFDLVEIDGQELVSMEYIDGLTLLDILRARAPLELAEGCEIASQFLAGLEAIHAADMVHRDVKPENIMMTRAGRVVVMDFGIAKSLAEAPTGTVSGTPAYMSPEQTRGDTLDARADVFAAGIVLAEMMAPNGLGTPDARRALWEGLHRDPPLLAETPWTTVLKRAVSPRKEQRYVSAAALARALEEVTLRAAGDEDLHPYPGLASFGEEDAEYFFGRELEVEEMWKKLARPHLLAVIGPSGAGKSSFLRAGLLAVMPTGWKAIVATPGNRPLKALSEALVAELAGDAEAMKELLSFDEPDAAVSVVSRWRQRHENALLIVDQFEELFTQNSAGVQERFSELLARLALEADVHVLLSMRDDFLFHCSSQESLAPIFSELTPLKALTGAALRRALVQPALKCGYRFEDDSLVDEMVREVETERGALPLLAFAADRLWTMRDREQGLLTREAFEHIGGVAGALAQHAEATLEGIGHEKIPLVRELFRNLVTADGTRATQRRDDLLSVFPEDDRPAAKNILAALIDARLLTSYEVASDDEDEEESEQRIEIIHESLLSNWPRLVRWQTQDADSAQLRDQIRQAARLWQERNRSEDLLWTGTAYAEFELWRERYPGRLTALEEDYATALVANAERRKRRRRLVAAAVLLLAVVVTAITGTLWRRSVAAEKETAAEALRAEASKLLALSRLEEERYPTAALAYATKSLELNDTPEARRRALKILSQGPMARILLTRHNPTLEHPLLFGSPDGEWLASSQPVTGEVYLFSRDGSLENVLRPPAAKYQWRVDFGPQSEYVVLHLAVEPLIHILSVPEGELIRTIKPGPPDDVAEKSFVITEVRGDRMFTWVWPGREGPPFFQTWSLPDGEPGTGRFVVHEASGVRKADPTGTWTAFAEPRGQTVYRAGIGGLAGGKPIVVGHHDTEIRQIEFSPDGDRLYLTDQSERVVVWSLQEDSVEVVRVIEGVKQDGLFEPRFDPNGSWLGWGSTAEGAIYLRDLHGPPEASPLRLGRHDADRILSGVFDPRGHWLATQHQNDLSIWTLGGSWSRRLEADGALSSDLVFSANGQRLTSCHDSGNSSTTWHWTLFPGETGEAAIPPLPCWSIAANPTRRLLLHADGFSPALLVRTADGSVEPLAGGAIDGFPGGLAFSSDGRIAAMGMWTPPNRPLRVWSLDSGELRVLPIAERPGGRSHAIRDLNFAPDGTLFSAGVGGVLRWDLDSGASELFHDSEMARIDLSEDGRRLLVTAGASTGFVLGQTELLLYELETGARREITTHGASVQSVALDRTGRILVTGDAEGVVRAGPTTGAEPHLLLGHEDHIKAVAVSPDGRWIYSGAGADIRRWSMPPGLLEPDLSQQPLHTLPLEELLAELHSRTNLRVVEDPESPDGWGLEVTSFSD